MLQKKSQSPLSRILILRFSSFGDIVQTAFVVESINDSEVDLLTKKDFSSAFADDFKFKNVYSYDKASSFRGLWRWAKKLSANNYDLVFDAHNNQRTLLFKLFMVLCSPKYILRFKTRSKYRWKRMMLFKLRLNLFPKPFKGALSFLTPLHLKLKSKRPVPNPTGEILLAPSAAWDLKKWPHDYWIELAKLFLKDHKVTFIGGPDDEFIADLHQACPGSTNLAGKLSWPETVKKIKSSTYLISGDTGVLHVADYFAVPATALMGPSAFGFPSRESSLILSQNLSCQPCSKDGRGLCHNKVQKKCLTSLVPIEVFNQSLKNLERFL